MSLKFPVYFPSLGSHGEASFLSHYLHFWRLSVWPIFGFILTYFAYYPGLLSIDPLVQLYELQNFSFSDWHPPMGAWVWSITDTFFPGPIGYFILHLILYWGSFFLIRLHFAQKPGNQFSFIGKITATLPFFPFLINFCGTLWKDVLVMSCLLTAFGLILLRIRHSFRSPLLTGIIFTLLIIGGLSRHNSLLAVAPLVLLYFWPDIRAQGKPLLSIFMKRLCVVTLASSLSLVTAKVIFEEAITQPTKMGLINTIFLFDLVGISTRIGVNLLPGSWRPDQTEAILTKCYQPHLVDSLLWGSCSFVAEALHDRVKERAEGDTSFRPNFPWPPWFGEREAWAKDRPLFPAWLQAVTHHPLAYLQHRLTHFQILFRPAYIFLAPDAEAYRYGFRLNGVYHTIERIVIFLGELPGLKLMFSVGFWYVASLGIFGLSLWTFSKKRENEAAHSQAYYALIASASASLYSLPLFFVSIADQYRYAFWTAAATCVACLFLWAARRAERKEI